MTLIATKQAMASSNLSSSANNLADTAWVGKKPLRRLGGMADALAIAADLGFSVPQVLPFSLSFACLVHEAVMILYSLQSLFASRARVFALTHTHRHTLTCENTHISLSIQQCQWLQRNRSWVSLPIGRSSSHPQLRAFTQIGFSS